MKKSVKITIYSILGVFLTLFFFFMITFDFTPSSRYNTTKSLEEVRSEFESNFNKSIEESKSLKVLNLPLNSSFINDFLNVIRKENGYDSINDNLPINGIRFSIQGERVVLTVHTSFKNKINYRVKIKTFFKLDEDETKYTLSLRRLNLGELPIPSFLTKSIINSSSEDSIGNLIESAINSINLGTYDKNKLEYTISKAEVVESIKNGSIGNLAYMDSEALRTITSLYISSLFNYNLLKIKVRNVLNISLDYSKLLNNDVSYPIEYNKALNENKDYLYAIEDNSILEYLVKSQNLTLSDDYLSSLLYLKLFNFFNDSNALRTIVPNLINSALFYHDGFLLLRLAYLFGSTESVIEIKFKMANNNALLLSSATIGFDESEQTGSYIDINKTSDINILIDLLKIYGIDVDYSTHVLNPKSLISESRITYSDASCGTYFYGLTLNNPHVNKISSACLSLDFNDSLPLEYKNKIDYSSIDNLLESYKTLDFALRIEYLKYLRDYFKETDISVYNYIDEII